MRLDTSVFGYISDMPIMSYTLFNSHGESIQILNYGGIVHAWNCLDYQGKIQDVLLGCPNLDGYLARHPYFGCIVGRYGNRIANGSFTLNGITYQLAQNQAPCHHLHGGIHGFDRKIYDVKIVEFEHNISLTLKSQSPHLEEGYPGNLDFSVVYTFHDNNALDIEYHATTDQDTHYNPTNHCYFNLSGGDAKIVLDHQVRIMATEITETNDDLIPTGKIQDIIGSNLDFMEYNRIGDRIFAPDHNLVKAKGYDHNFVLLDHDEHNPVASVIEPTSRRRLQVFTTEPAIQLYTGNWLEGTQGKDRTYQDYAGFCLETQHYPDTPNHPNFPSTVLKKGDTFYSKTVYKMDCY